MRQLLARFLVFMVLVGVAGLGLWWFQKPSASDEKLTRIDQLSQLCADLWPSITTTTYFPDGAAHEGQGPHPIEIFQRSDLKTSWTPLIITGYEPENPPLVIGDGP